MQLTVRSYLMAGMAAAGAGALAIAPLPSLVPDVTVPSVEAPVALAAAPSFDQLLALGIADSAAVTSGAFGSGSNAAGFLSGDTSYLGNSFALLPSLIASNPEMYLPLAATSVAFAPLSAIQLAEPQFTGVNASGQNPLTGAYTLPGQADNVAIQPITTAPGFALKPTVVAPINAAAGKVATDFDNLSASVGGPTTVARTLTGSASAVGTSVVQAQGLVRTAGLGTLSAATQAAIARNPQGVATAIQNAPGNLQKAVFGDTSVPLVSPTTGQPSTASNAVAPVKRLGAIGTVSSTVQKAANDVGNAVGGGS